MGTDTPVPVISDRPRMLYEYFKQLFAQVTNPPLDANFEALVTSLNSTIGPEGNLLDPGPDSCRQIVCPSPILTNEELAKLRYIDDGDGAVDGLPARHRLLHYPVAEGGEGLRMAIDNVRTQVSDGDRVTARTSSSSPIATPTPRTRRSRRCSSRAAVHHHLVREKTRTRVGLVVETGEAREVHHFASAARVRRRRDQPVPRVRHDPRPVPRGCAVGPHRAQGGQELRQGRGQGHPQGDVEDGHLDGRVVHRCADLRGRRARSRRSSTSTSPAPRRASRASTST